MNHSRFLPEALNVTYKGRSPGFPDFIPLLIRPKANNGLLNKTFLLYGRQDYSCGNSPRIKRDSLLTPIPIGDLNIVANLINFLNLPDEYL